MCDIHKLASLLSSEQAAFKESLCKEFLDKTGLQPHECEIVRIDSVGDDYTLIIREINNHGNKLCARIWLSVGDVYTLGNRFERIE